jgi:aspartate/methionine/tyrosine aminotransferase
LIAPPDLVRPVELLAQNLFISPPALAQEAALAAFACRDELDARVETYRRSRAALLECLPQGGSTGSPPSMAPFTCTLT